MQWFRRTLIISVVLVSQVAMSASNEQKGFVTESGLNIIPFVESALEYNDNIGRYSKNEAAETSFLFDISPGVAVKVERGENEYSAAYQLSSGTYFDSSDDNYLDHRFTTNNFFRFNQRNGLALNYSYLYEHEERGTGVFAGDSFSTIASKPVEYALHDVNATYVFGSDGAQGRLEGLLGYSDKQYKNYRYLNDDFEPFGTSYKDYAEAIAGASFFYKTSSANYVVFEVEVIDRSYSRKVSGESQDSLDIFYLIGDEWEITGKTTGKVRLGYQDKSYTSDQREDFGGFSWNAEISWSPVDYSTVDVNGGQRAEDPDQSTGYLRNSFIDVQWKHFWRYNIFSDLGAGFQREDYSTSDRLEDKVETKIGIGYVWNKDLNMQAYWEYESNDSTIDTQTYTQNLYAIALDYTF